MPQPIVAPASRQLSSKTPKKTSRRGGRQPLRNRGPAHVGDDNDQEDAEQRVEEDPDQGEAQGDGAPPSVAPKESKQHPQKRINKVWKNYDPQYLGRVTRILPEVATPTVTAKSISRSQNASESYRQAKEQCERDVQKIIDECYALNQKYTDVHFDLESDLKVTGNRDCIDGLVDDRDTKDQPWDVKRVTDLFDNPRFFSEGAGFDDIMQGGLGDCWLMSAFSILTCREGSIDRVCVKRDQEVGVYGFVFFRGE